MSVIWTSDAYFHETNAFNVNWKQAQRYAYDRVEMLTLAQVPASLGPPPGGWGEVCHFHMVSGDGPVSSGSGATRAQTLGTVASMAGHSSLGGSFWSAFEVGFVDPNVDSAHGFRPAPSTWQNAGSAYHHTASTGTAPFSFKVGGSASALDYRVWMRGGTNVNPSAPIIQKVIGAFAYGWWRLKYFINWSTTAGRVKVWAQRPGESGYTLRLDYSGPIGFTDSPDTYPKDGMYQGVQNITTHCYMAGSRYGTTEADVDASGGGGGGTPPPTLGNIPALPAGKTRYGITVGGSQLSVLGADRKRGSKIAVAQNFNLEKIWMAIQGTGASGSQAIRPVVYDDTGGSGEPGARVYNGDEITKVAPFDPIWQAATLATPQALTAGDYWAFLHTGAVDSLVSYFNESVAGSRRFNDDVYSDGPANPAGAMSTDDRQLTMCLEGTLTGGGGGGGNDTTPPAFQLAQVFTNVITLNYDEPLDPASVPLPSHYSVMVDINQATVTAVSISGSQVSLTISISTQYFQTVSVSYSPASPFTQDVAGNHAAGFSNQIADNNNDAPDQRINGQRVVGTRIVG